MREYLNNQQPKKQEADHIAFTNQEDAIRFLKMIKEIEKKPNRPPTLKTLKKTKSPDNPTANLDKLTMLEVAAQTHLLKILENLPNYKATIRVIRNKLGALTDPEFNRVISALTRDKKIFLERRQGTLNIKLQNE